jgi:flagellar basal body-associated protein FliL
VFPSTAQGYLAAVVGWRCLRPRHRDAFASRSALERLSLGILACALGGAACVGPARSFGVYEAKATNSVETAGSAVETARMAALQALRDRNFGPYLAVTAADAESDVSTAQGHFTSIQPPDAPSDRLRTITVDLLSRADRLVAQTRIALRRGDTAVLQRLVDRLAAASKDLDSFVEHHL